MTTSHEIRQLGFGAPTFLMRLVIGIREQLGGDSSYIKMK